MIATRRLGRTRDLRALTAALSTALPLSSGTAQSPQPPSKAVVAARVDSMARAYMAEKGPASMSVAISRERPRLQDPSAKHRPPPSAAPETAVAA